MPWVKLSCSTFYTLFANLHSVLKFAELSLAIQCLHWCACVLRLESRTTFGEYYVHVGMTFHVDESLSKKFLDVRKSQKLGIISQRQLWNSLSKCLLLREERRNAHRAASPAASPLVSSHLNETTKLTCSKSVVRKFHLMLVNPLQFVRAFAIQLFLCTFT